MEQTDEPQGPPLPTAPPDEAGKVTPLASLQLTPPASAKVSPDDERAGPTDPGSSASTARAPAPVALPPPEVPQTQEAQLTPTTFPGTGGHGPRQAPCFNHSGDKLFVPAGSTLSCRVLGAGAPSEVASASLGLSDVMQAAAYDPALRLIFCGDQNGLASRLVALDAATLALRWTTPAGDLNSCCGLAVLPQQSLVVAASLDALHVRHCGSGGEVAKLVGVGDPTFLAADAATATVYASTVRRTVGGRGPGASAAAPQHLQQHVVSAFQWDPAGAALVLLGEVREAGVAAAPRPLCVVRAGGSARAHLLVGTCGSPELVVLALPSCCVVHRLSLPPPPPALSPAATAAASLQPGPLAIAGCAAAPSGDFIAVVDAAAGGSTHVLAWPLPGFPVPPAPPPQDAAAFVCLCCRQRVPGRPAGSCPRCPPPAAPPALKGWLCEACLAQHSSGGRLARHAGSARAAAPGLLRAPLVSSPASPAAPLSPAGGTLGGGSGGGPPLLQACVSPGPGPALFVPRGSGVELFGAGGAPLPHLSAAALGLAAGAVACSAFDGASGALLVSDGARVAAIDVDTRAVRWSVAVPGCVGLCVLHRGPGETGGGVVIAAARDPGRLCGFAVRDGSPLQPGGGVLSTLPGAPCAVAGDDRSGMVFVDVPLPPQLQQQQQQPQPQQRYSQQQPSLGAAPAALPGRQPLRRPIHAFQWSTRGSVGQLEPLGPVEVPTDDPAAPRPLTIVPPAPGQHSSYLVVAGTAGRAVMLHVLELPHCRLVHSHALEPLESCALAGIAGDPGGTALVVLDWLVPRDAGAAGGALDVRLLPWPLPGQALSEPCESFENLMELVSRPTGGGGRVGGAAPVTGSGRLAGSQRLPGIRPPADVSKTSCGACAVQ